MKIIIIFISILMILTTILKAEELKQSSNDPLLDADYKQPVRHQPANNENPTKNIGKGNGKPPHPKQF
uniref:Uncharacterized protein n=1 Tax=Meloidogyne enterolobii TaxID=390850 RepID=A0A6V7V5M3_MELEN|nr:unnamed protein product [Meloidogyne enterolobii]